MIAMEDGLLSLKWNNHRGTFLQVLSTLRRNATYTDATLVCDAKFYSVHRFVISACSDYFKEIFQQISSPSPVVVLKDISSCDLESLLDYMYLGKVDVKQNDLSRLVKAAEYLQIKGLAAPDKNSYLFSNGEPTKVKSTKRLLQEGNLTTTGKKLKPQLYNDLASDIVYLSHQGSTQSEVIENQHIDTNSSGAMEAITIKTDPENGPVIPANILYLKDEQTYLDMKFEDSGILSEMDEQKLESAGTEYSCNHDPGPSIIPEDSILKQWTEDQSYDSICDDNTNQQMGSMHGQRRLGVIYQCLYCIKMFRDKTKWTTHSRTHTGEKPFQCPYCTYRASIKANVNRHIANIHYSVAS